MGQIEAFIWKLIEKIIWERFLKPILLRKITIYIATIILIAFFSIIITIIGCHIYCSFTPKPQATINSPEDFDGKTKVPDTISVNSNFINIPKNRFPWVVVRVPIVRPMRKVYPQPSSKIPSAVPGNGNYTVPVTLGGLADSGKPFNIEILLLNKKTNDAFNDYARNGNGSGINLPEKGAELLDYITVIRQ